MMIMCMAPRQRQIVTIKVSLNLEEAFCRSVFPKTETILNDNFNENYFKYICINKQAMFKRYTSELDFLFCELFGVTKHRKHFLRDSCFAYYRGEGPKLIEQLSKDDLEVYDNIMSSIILPMLKEKIDSFGKRPISWKWVTQTLARGLIGNGYESVESYLITEFK